MSEAEQELERMRRRIRELEAQQAIDPGEAGGENSDEEIEILEEVAHKPNYHGLDKQWVPLQDCLASLVTSKYETVKTKVQAYECAAKHVKAWVVVGYTYEKIKQMTQDAEERVKQDKEEKHDLNKFFWLLLNKVKKSKKIDATISCSFLVDKTVEHVKKVLADLSIPKSVTPSRQISTPSRQTSRGSDNKALQQPKSESTGVLCMSPEPSTSQDRKRLPPPVYPSEAAFQLPGQEDAELESFLTLKLRALFPVDAKTTKCSTLILDAISESGLTAKDLLQMSTVDNRLYGNNVNLGKVITHCLRQVNIAILSRYMTLVEVVDLLVEFCYVFNKRFPDYKAMVTSNHPANGRFTDLLRQADPPRRPHSPPRPASPPSSIPGSPPRSYRRQESYSPPRKYVHRQVSPSRIKEESSPSIRSSSKRCRSPPMPPPYSSTPPPYSATPMPLPPEVDCRRSASRHTTSPPRRSGSLIDVSNFKASSKSLDSNLHRMVGHPLKKEQDMDPKHIDNYPLVALDTVIVGAGLKNSELVQIGVHGANGRKLFAPILPSFQDEDKLGQLGFKKSTSRFKFRHPKQRQLMDCSSLADTFVELCAFLRDAQGHMDGVVLVILNKETLLAFLKTVGKQSPNIRQQFISLVKGYVVLEPLVRTNILRSTVEREIRLNVEDLGILFNISNPGDSSDDVSKTLMKVAQNSDVKKHIASNTKKLKMNRVDEVAKVLEKLAKFQPLIRFVAVKLGQNKNLSLKGIFDPFPQKFLLDASEFISNKFVELLVYNDQTMDKLSTYDVSYGSNELFKRIKDVVIDNIGDQRDKTMKIIEDCITNTVEWTTNVYNANSRDRQMYQSGLGTPTYDSEGSMPEELPRPKSPFKSPEYSRLEEFLITELPNTNKGKFTQETIKYVAWLMAKAWENVGYTWLELSQRCMDPAVTLETFENDMDRRFRAKYPDKPKEWKGFARSDLLEKTYMYFRKATSYKDKEFKALEKHFVEAVSNKKGHSKDAVASAAVINIAKALTKAWEAIDFTYKNLLMKVTQSKQGLLAEAQAAQLKNSLSKKFPTPPASWGGFNYDFIVQETFAYFKDLREATKDMMDDRKRKREGDGVPAMDVRKKRRIELEESWKKEVVGIEDEMDALQAYCDRIKKDSWEFSQSKDIIIQMAKLLDRNRYSLKGIKETLKIRDEFGKELEMVTICRSIFGDDKRKQTKKGAYDGQSDMVIFGDLLKRFCSYVSNPHFIKDDIAFKPVVDSCADNENMEPVYIESMETIEAIIEELQKRYQRHAKGIPRDYENLHRYLYYNAPIKTVQATIPVYTIVRELVMHLDSKLRCKDLTKNIEKLRDDKVTTKELNEEIGRIVKKEKFPANCRSKSGLLLNSVTEYFYRKRESFPIGEASKSVKMKVDPTLPEKYQKHIFYCFVEEAIQMNSSGELEGFDVSFIDPSKLSFAVRDTVAFMIDCGFNMYEAISNYIDGNLIEVLKKLIKPHEDVNPEANHTILLTRLTYDFIDSTVKNEAPTLPIPKTHRNLLKRRVVNLIKNGQFFQTELFDKVNINLAIPKMEQETLEPISASGDETATVGPTTENSEKNNNGDNERDLKGEFKHEMRDDVIPGSVVLFKVIVIPPLKQKKFFANVFGLPKIKKDTLVRIEPVAESILIHKVEMTTQTTEVQMDMTVLVSVQNKSETEVVRLPRGLIIATADVMDKSSILEERLNPSYCLQFIRHHNRYRDPDLITVEGDKISFGKGNFITKFDKTQRTNFRIFGMKYVCGRHDYYTVDAVVYFLNIVKNIKNDYETYLRLTINHGVPIVRLKDAQDLHDYLHGKVGICPQIDKSFTSEKDKELNKEFLEMKKIDDDLLDLPNIKVELNENQDLIGQSNDSIEKENDKNRENKDIENNVKNEDQEENPNKKLILQLKEFLMYNYEMKLPQIKEEITLFIELLGQCGYTLSKLRLDLFAVPSYREVLKNVLKQKLHDLLEERGYLIGDSADFDRLNKMSMASFQNLPKPTKVKDLRSFLALAKKFSAEIPDLERPVGDLGSFSNGKVLEDDFGWTGNADKLFEDIRKSIASVTSLKPATADGMIEFYSAASSDCISAVIVQEQTNPNDDDRTAWYPIAYNSRLLTPEEEKLVKIEKEAHAVIWGINFNKAVLYQIKFRLNVTSDQLGKMFTAGNVNTASWAAQLEPYTFSVNQIKQSENPAMCLTKRNEREERRPYATENLIPCLLDETLRLMKRNGKSRNRWIKFQTKRRKRAHAERIEKNVGMVESGNFDFEYQPKVSKFSGGTIPRGTPTSSGSTFSSKSTGSVQFGPTIDFIIATSTTESNAEPQDIACDAVGPRSTLPMCNLPTYQPLFEMNFSYLVGVKQMEWGVAKEKADKTFTKLMLNNVEYDELKQFVAKLVRDNPEVEQNGIINALNGFLKSKGIDKLFLKEEFLKQCVEHFYMVLKIRPKIKLKLREKKQKCKESEALYDAEGMVEENIAIEEPKEPENIEESGWFLDLLENDVENVPRERVNWSFNYSPPPKPQKVPETPPEPQPQEYKSFEKLKGYYDKTIQSLTSKDEKKRYERSEVTGSVLIKCWIIAQVDCNHLHFIYKDNIAKGRSAVLEKLQRVLDPYEKILPIKGSYKINLVSWTYKYFKSITNSGGSLHSLYQRTQLMRIQKEGKKGEMFAKLESFFVSVMLIAHDKKQEEASQIASHCIHWFQLCGFSYQTLKDLFMAAACISTCLDQLYNSLMHMFKNISCLLPQTVDIERLIKYTLVYYRAEAVFTEVISEDRQNCGDNLTTLYPLVTHANQVIMADTEGQKDVNMGNVIIKNELLLQPGDSDSVEGRISWLGRPPSPGTPLRMVTHPFTKIAHKTVDVVERTWHYDGLDVEVAIRNNSKSNAVRIGNPGRALTIAEIQLGPPTSKMVSDQCEASAEIFARHGIDLNKLAKLYKVVVQGTEGCAKVVAKIALQHCVKTLSHGRDLTQGQIYLFDAFIKEALKYSSRVSIVEEDVKEKGDEKEVGMIMESVDIEDGEVLSDEEDEKDVKVRDKEVDRKEEVEEEEVVGGMISFGETQYTEEELNKPPVKQIGTVDLVSLLRQYHSDIDLTPVSGHIIVGKYLVPNELPVQLGEAKYNIYTVVMFLNNSQQHHPDYVKKVSATHPDLPLVRMDHRKLLLSAFSKDVPENSPVMMVELEVLTKNTHLQRMYVKFKDLCRRQTQMCGLPSLLKENQYRPLFEKYFNEIFYCGLGCQTNWYEVARVASEELIHCWISAEFQYSHLLKNMTTVIKEKNPKYKKERYKKVFLYFLNELQQHEEKLPPVLNLRLFVKKTIDMIETIEVVNKLNETEQENDSDQLQQKYIDINSDEESEAAQASRDSSIMLSSGEEEDESDGELLRSLKDLNQKTDLKSIAEMEEEALQNKRKELKRQLTEERDEGEEGIITDKSDDDGEISSSSANLAVDPKTLSCQLDMLSEYVGQCSKDVTTDCHDSKPDIESLANDQDTDEPMESSASLDLESSVHIMSSIAEAIRKDNEGESAQASEEEVESIPSDTE